jgi:hypothetical protein
MNASFDRRGSNFSEIEVDAAAFEESTELIRFADRAFI